jgi:hypothetical protein
VVDFDPWKGNYSNLLVEDNRIYGGFAERVSPHHMTNPKPRADLLCCQYGNDSQGIKNEKAVIKIGMAIGPLVWWGE